MSAISASGAWPKVSRGNISTTREVYLTDRGTVIKIAKSGQEYSNKQEASLWERYQDPSLLAPVVNYDDEGRWLEMVACYSFEDGKYEETLEAFEQKMEDAGLDIHDLHAGNIGVLPTTRELVCVDYGAGVE